MRKLDAIAHATVGYHARRQPDPRVLLCCPLMGTTEDLSRYRNQVIPNTFSYTTGSEWNMRGCLGTIRYNLAKHLDGTQPWTIETWWASSNSRSTRLYAGYGNYLASNILGGCLYSLTTASVAWIDAGSAFSPAHVALVSDGINVRLYLNGAYVTQGRNGSISNIILEDVGWIELIVPTTETYGVCNLRVVQAALHRQTGNTYSYPVPAQPYTGMEVLP